jgi:CMP-N,N'-diacetyllegionaminic acid synthase
MFCGIILARSGSKGILGKNLVDLCGQPLIYWTIKFAQLSDQITDIVISSDSSEILNIAKDIGVSEAIMRPKHLARDLATDIEAFSHVLTASEIVKSYDFIAHLRPTNPFRKLSWWQDVVQKTKTDLNFTSIRSIEPATENPYKMWKLDQHGQIENVIKKSHISNHHSAPRQILPKVFKQNAHLDILRKQTILDGEILGQNPLGLLVESGLPDIDTMQDLDLARVKFRNFIDALLIK